MLGLVGAVVDELRVGLRPFDVAEVAELVLCWCRLSGEDTPAERVIKALPKPDDDSE